MSSIFKTRIQAALGFELGNNFGDDYLVTQVEDCVKALEFKNYAKESRQLRERFAGMAMQGILSNPNIEESDMQTFAKSSVLLADALIAELERTK